MDNENIDNMTDEKIFFELMKRCKIRPSKDTLFNGKRKVYDVSNYTCVACQFVFDDNGKFIELSCYN